MLTLSLLLGAAAGVNAILGGEVIGVKVAEGEYICADDCAYNGAFLGQRGFYCPLEEVVHRVTSDGTDDSWFRYQCAGDKLPDGYTERSRREGEEPKKCYSVDGEFECLSYRSLGGPKHPKTIEWSELAEQLKKAKSQDEQSSPEKTSPEKPVNNPFKDPKTLVVPRILNKDDYDAGIRALKEGNYQWNRYMLIERFNDIAYSDNQESEIKKLQQTNNVRRSQALKSITTAKTKFTTAFGPEFSGEINQTIDGARYGLELVWAKAQDTNFRQLIELGDLLQEKTKQQ